MCALRRLRGWIHQVFDYARADVTGLKFELHALDWQHCFRDSAVEDNWATFKRKLQELELKYVPVKSICVGKTKPMWMSYKAMKAVKHRHKVYRKYKDHSHPACRNANRQASVAVRNSRWHFEHKLSLNIKEDKKSFFSYARSKTKTKAVMWCLEALPRLEAASRQNFHCLGLGLGLD